MTILVRVINPINRLSSVFCAKTTITRICDDLTTVDTLDTTVKKNNVLS